jgi:Transcription factor WhiB
MVTSGAKRDWMARAACAAYPAAWWFPEEDPDAIELGRVREICLYCPVRRDCLDFALREDRRGMRGTHGIYAGLTEGQRSSLKRGVCVGCRRNEDPAQLWGRVGNWRATGCCGACDTLRRAVRETKNARARAAHVPVAPPPPPEVLEAEAEWWARQRAAIAR